MNEDDKLDLILKKLEENERRLTDIENRTAKEEKREESELSSIEKRVERVTQNKTKRYLEIDLVRLVKIAGIILVVVGALMFLLTGFSIVLGMTGTSFSALNSTTTSLQFFNGPTGQVFNQSILNGFTNLSSQLATVGSEQLAGNIKCYGAQAQTSAAPATPAYCVLVLPDNNYDIIPIPVPSSFNAPSVDQSGKPTFVYVGAQGCPYCAQERYVFTVALSRFGNFSKLFYDRSATIDGNISTLMYNFSASLFNQFVVNAPLVNNGPYGDSNPTPFFEGAYYNSSYINFNSFDEVGSSFLLNISGIPAFIQNSVITPARNGFGITNFQLGGVPFFDINNKFVFDGANIYPALLNYQGSNQPSISQILYAIHNPSLNNLNGFGETVLGAANILTAQICDAINNSAPVCSLGYISTLQQKISSAYSSAQLNTSSFSITSLSYLYMAMVAIGIVLLFLSFTGKLP